MGFEQGLGYRSCGSDTRHTNIIGLCFEVSNPLVPLLSVVIGVVYLYNFCIIFFRCYDMTTLLCCYGRCADV